MSEGVTLTSNLVHVALTTSSSFGTLPSSLPLQHLTKHLYELSTSLPVDWFNCLQTFLTTLHSFSDLNFKPRRPPPPTMFSKLTTVLLASIALTSTNVVAQDANPPKFDFGKADPNAFGVVSRNSNGPTNPDGPQMNTPINQTSDARLAWVETQLRGIFQREGEAGPSGRMVFTGVSLGGEWWWRLRFGGGGLRLDSSHHLMSEWSLTPLCFLSFTFLIISSIVPSTL